MLSKKDIHMKWWGWGDEQKSFNMIEKPNLWPYIQKSAGIDNELSDITHPAVMMESISLPPAKLNEEFLHALRSFLKSNQIYLDHYQRILHTYGKSFRDLWRIRQGIIKTAPDCVLYPESETEVEAIIKTAQMHNVIVIPFGGGSNIAGCLESSEDQRMIVSLDMKRMNQVIAIDERSMIAKIQAGILGPELEAVLNKRNLTLGHFPDSFEYSSLGGWIATRSAGMKSDKYGKIEDMVISLRMVTPHGIITTRTVPKSSNGIDVNHLCIGSEGILGVITEVTMQIHRLPEYNVFYGYLFPNFESGVAALYECARQNCLPAMTRLNDAEKTALSFAFKTKQSWLKTFFEKGIKFYLKKIKKVDFKNACILLLGIEGDKKSFYRQKKEIHQIYQRFGGCYLGKSPGKSFEKVKYDFPYLRDFVMDYGISADVSETSTVWSNLLPLYYKTRDAILTAIEETGSKAWCTCHISHSYQTGASLYFTFACKQKKGNELEQYLHIKHAAENAFMEGGGTLSHHHAVGYEHMPWLEQDISSIGIKAIQGIKKTLDPQSIMNPGKIIHPEMS